MRGARSTTLEVAADARATGGHARRSRTSTCAEAAQQKTLLYDKAGEEHYNVI